MPSVRLGTKWLSITSTCSQSALETAAASSASLAKSADRMLGAIWIPIRPGILPIALEPPDDLVGRRHGGNAFRHGRSPDHHDRYCELPRGLELRGGHL